MTLKGSTVKSAASIPNPTGHPARYSGAVVDKLRSVLLDRYPGTRNTRPLVFDPFAGTGERLAELLGDDFDGSGIELHKPFIVNRKLVRVGDATRPKCYPTRPFVIVTSPVYPNGMAESWNVSESDTSKRNTYSAALAKLGATPKPNDMGRLGYRGTKRGGRSVKRAAYWDLARRAVNTWSENDYCTAIFLNVSDFLSGGEVEPFVADWKAVLREHGWRVRVSYKVRTPRHQGNDNADQRVEHETILVAERG